MHKVTAVSYECYCGATFNVGEEDEFDHLRDYCPECREERYALWKEFIKELGMRLDDPLLCAIFSHGKLVKYDDGWGQVFVWFPKKLEFFKETLRETMPIWSKAVYGVFGQNAVVIPLFGDEDFKVD